MQGSEYATEWRVVANTSVGQMVTNSYGPHDSREDAEEELRDIERRQAASPFPAMGAYIERRVGDHWEREL